MAPPNFVELEVEVRVAVFLIVAAAIGGHFKDFGSPVHRGVSAGSGSQVGVGCGPWATTSRRTRVVALVES